MKKTFLISTALAALLMASPVMAHDMDGPGGPGGDHHPKTLEGARTKAHERSTKLDGMTQAEWDAKQAKRAERKAKWDAMSDTEKAAKKAEWKAHKEKWKSATPEERAKMKKEHDAKEGVPVPAPAQ